MPTLLTHAFVPIAVSKTVTDKKMPRRFWVLSVLCAILPDLDVIGSKFGIAHADFLGHRAFSHSLFFALILSSVVTLFAFRKTSLFSKKWWLIWAFLFAASASHGLFDTFTDRGSGVALFSPFDTTPYLSPWRPLSPSSIGVRALCMFWAGRDVLISETVWIWLPLTAMLIIAKVYRKRRKRTNPALRVNG